MKFTLYVGENEKSVSILESIKLHRDSLRGVISEVKKPSKWESYRKKLEDTPCLYSEDLTIYDIDEMYVEIFRSEQPQEHGYECDVDDFITERREVKRGPIEDDVETFVPPKPDRGKKKEKRERIVDQDIDRYRDEEPVKKSKKSKKADDAIREFAAKNTKVLPTVNQDDDDEVNSLLEYS
jgi:hypothetical protein